jgi:uncharacterized membrane protein
MEQSPIQRAPEVPPASIEGMPVPGQIDINEFLVEQWIGKSPLPPPDILQRYDEVLPGATERLLRMVEDESAHRRKLENRQMDSEVAEAHRGQWMAFFITVFTIAIGAYTALQGAQVTGTFIGAGGVIALAAVFIRGRQRRNP